VAEAPQEVGLIVPSESPTMRGTLRFRGWGRDIDYHYILEAELLMLEERPSPPSIARTLFGTMIGIGTTSLLSLIAVFAVGNPHVILVGAYVAAALVGLTLAAFFWDQIRRENEQSGKEANRTAKLVEFIRHREGGATGSPLTN
jgi:hypothetical protein